MLFHVTAERIARSRPAHCQFCAVALTILDELPAARSINVYPNGARDTYFVSFWLPAEGSLPRSHIYQLPVDAKAIDAYDLEIASLLPFTFELPVPQDI